MQFIVIYFEHMGDFSIGIFVHHICVQFQYRPEEGLEYLELESQQVMGYHVTSSSASTESVLCLSIISLAPLLNYKCLISNLSVFDLCFEVTKCYFYKTVGFHFKSVLIVFTLFLQTKERSNPSASGPNQLYSIIHLIFRWSSEELIV